MLHEIKFSLLPQPDLAPVPDTELWELQADWYIDLPVSGKRLLIRKGFRTDGASIPRFLWPVVGSPFDPNYIAPALAHDALYEAELLDRPECDAEFRELLNKNGDHAADKASTFYRAVRCCGWKTWYFDHTSATILAARSFASFVSKEGPPA